MKTAKLLITLLFISLIFSCSSDEDTGGLEGVPSGEIVSVELRNVTLTGFNELSGKSNNKGNSQVWWSNATSDFKFTGSCPEDGDYEDENFNTPGFFAFYPNGKMYYKSSVGGDPTFFQNWRWTDSNKTHVYVRDETDVAYEITYLNSKNVVYGSKRSEGGCTLVSYEQMSR